MENNTEVLQAICSIALAAGLITMRHYGAGVDAAVKGDNSPVTLADTESDSFIVSSLLEEWPGIPVVSEETAGSNPSAPSSSRFWLVDPLDGTKSYIRGEGSFTVNIGLIEDDKPVLGVVHCPALNTTYYGGAGVGAWKKTENKNPIAIKCKAPSAEGIKAVVSSDHGGTEREWLEKHYKVVGYESYGSSLKICKVAEGAADIYPRTVGTWEWDTAAAHALLIAAGGSLRVFDGQTIGRELAYCKPGLRNSGFTAFSNHLPLPE